MNQRNGSPRETDIERIIARADALLEACRLRRIDPLAVLEQAIRLHDSQCAATHDEQ